MLGTFSWSHLLIIALLFVVLFGAKRLPDAARGLGRSLRIFKSEVSQMQNESPAAGAAPAQQPAQQLPPAQPSNQATTPQTETKSV
ncbi:sec-independent protein translocase protein TatA [Nocardia amikacinitolerans]|uniref:Sec-independent protein translocase protein TatA n=1 Tax=Nocardia amikacinitolerans TaxID=756689 RepID=A0A285L381_9NOCA|nr:Sec-independent protein translocase subunit TatA [Nocardia amikacinitolerans]SNY79378.1 sec-independent protein translocase protein TatA [Nocardia amikacinitolerans]